jgi:ribonucleoside-diphosphate reductase alpha chain
MDTAELSRAVWLSKYCLSTEEGKSESRIGDTWRRVARAAACAESRPDDWAPRFEELLSGFRFLPGGRVLAGAGANRRVTLFNCFVAGRLDDSIDGILRALGETATTMQQGGGVGIDFSPLRPAGASTKRTGSTASGPVSFMALWDTLCATLLSTSARRGAMMGTLACDHPDIEAFVTAKHTPGALRNFNLSVLVSDEFMQAVAADRPWQLNFPTRLLGSGETAGQAAATVSAQSIWRRIVESAHATAEPGMLFIDTINRENNLHYCEKISATNPCGEVPLPPFGCCDLGSINLAKFVQYPFTEDCRLDLDGIRRTAALAVRFLDNVIDVSEFPLPAQAEEARSTRRIGLGVTGLADALAMLGLRYSSEEGRQLAVALLEAIRDEAYAASIELARTKGAFPRLDHQRYLASPFIARLPKELRDDIAAHGIRNSHLLSIAPAGTISLLAGNVSGGIEPIYALEALRGIRGADGELHEHSVRDYAYNRWLAFSGSEHKLPDAFETATELSAAAHLDMQARLQPLVDNAISKTINLPGGASVDDVDGIFAAAHAAGIKGCTVYREGASVGQVLRRRPARHCCNTDREAD